MSTTIPVTGAGTSAPAVTSRDELIARATSLPDLISSAQALDPELAAVLTGKAKSASLTPLGGLLAGLVAGIAAHYGLGWSESFDAEVAGAAVAIGGYVTHWMQALAARPVLVAPAGK